MCAERSSQDRRDQPGKAALAAATAFSTCSAVPSGACARTSPVAGLYTSKVVSVGTDSPLIDRE